MSKLDEIMSLTPKVIIRVETPLGYMQVLEYILHDYSFLHVVQWCWNATLAEDGLTPNLFSETFYRESDKALDFAQKIGNNMLERNINVNIN